MSSLNQEQYLYLLSVTAIRERAQAIYQLAESGKTHFQLNLNLLNAVADLVAKITRIHYPDNNIPLHARWRHFMINNEDRSRVLFTSSALDAAKAQFDLAMISVLLDAGAGQQWRYTDKNGINFSRSEGLAVASLELFFSGFFSSDSNHPWRVDGSALLNLKPSELAAGLQVNVKNPLDGLEGRWQLLQQLGQLLVDNKAIFPETRPSGFIDFIRQSLGDRITASQLVHQLLLQLNSIWPGKAVNHYYLGDVWEYPGLGWIPFHKLSLWLTLSLIEPLQTAGMTITGLGELPGLAEYRNGGLFIDGGVLSTRDPDALRQQYQPSDLIIIEWRALTLVLLEKLAPMIRQILNIPEDKLPLVNILQGGTWQTGRELALQRSPDGCPPLRYVSTGTTF